MSPIDYHERAIKAWDTRGRGSAGRPAESAPVGVWTKDGEWIPNDSEEARTWGEGKGISPGDAPAPFPVWTKEEQARDPTLGKDWWTGHRKINKEQPTEGSRKVGSMYVPVSDLIATQHVVQTDTVKMAIPRLKAEMASGGIPKKAATIVRVGGKSFIYDGHHRASAAKIGGMSHVWADVFEVD